MIFALHAYKPVLSVVDQLPLPNLGFTTHCGPSSDPDLPIHVQHLGYFSAFIRTSLSHRVAEREPRVSLSVFLQ